MRLRSALAALALLLALGGAGLAGAGLMEAPTAGAQTPPTTVVPLPDEGPGQRPSIIPLPNSGRAPEREGDPGSATQYAVMGGIILGLGAIGLLIARDSKKHAANKTHTPGPREPQEPVGSGVD